MATTSKAAPRKAMRKATAGTTTRAVHHQTSVPDKKLVKEYIGRKIGKLDDFQVFDFAARDKENVLLEGPTGPGKTMAVRTYAAKTNRHFYSIPSNVGVEPSQLFGKYIPDGHGSFEWVDGPVTTLVRNGGVLLINEVNFMPERVATVLFSLLDDRREIMLLDHKSEVIQAHDDLVIFADMNPDYEGTRPLNKAFRNRFAVQLHWDYDPVVEAKLIDSAVLREIIKQLRVQYAAEAITTPISTNMGMEFVRVAKGLDIEFAVTNFVTHFHPVDRESINNVFEANMQQLVDEFAKDDNERLDWNREHATKGYVDPEWGVYGLDWCRDDDEEFADYADEEDDTVEV